MAMLREIPQERPAWSPRLMSAAEVVRLVQGNPVPGVDEQHPLVHEMKRGLPGSQAALAFAEARRQGYLFVNTQLYDSPDEVAHLRDVWRWWCAAAGHPEVSLSVVPSRDGTQIACDIMPTGQAWTFGAFVAIGKLLEPLVSYQEGAWEFTTHALELDGIEMDEAIHIARALVDLGTAGRFREGVYDEGPAPIPGRTAFPAPMSPMERSDG